MRTPRIRKKLIPTELEIRVPVCSLVARDYLRRKLEVGVDSSDVYDDVIISYLNEETKKPLEDYNEDERVFLRNLVHDLWRCHHHWKYDNGFPFNKITQVMDRLTHDVFRNKTRKSKRSERGLVGGWVDIYTLKSGEAPKNLTFEQLFGMFYKRIE